MERLEHMNQLESKDDLAHLRPFAPQPHLGESTWLASRLLHRQVVDVSAIEPVGRVVDLVFDPNASLVMGLVIQPTSYQRGPRAMLGRLLNQRPTLAIVGLDHVISMAGDVVMVNADPFRLTTSHEMERMPRLNAICEMTILTVRGSCLGTLADLLLEEQGATINSYVVSPTALGEQALPALVDLTPLAEEPASAPVPGMRVIPASANVRIGKSLILLMAEVEPLREEVVVVSQAVEERVELTGA